MRVAAEELYRRVPMNLSDSLEYGVELLWSERNMAYNQEQIQISISNSILKPRLFNSVGYELYHRVVSISFEIEQETKS